MTSEVILYQTEDGRALVQLRAMDGSVWLSQMEIAELFATTKQNISLHAKNILEEGELPQGATVKDSLTVQNEGARKVRRNTRFYSLPMILAIGYRVRSPIRADHSWPRRPPVRKRTRKRLKGCPRKDLQAPTRPGEQWAMDFTSDALADGRALRTLNVVDTFTRECVAIEVGTSLPSLRVARVLDRLIHERGRPEVNHQHRHSGIGMMTPASVHEGRAEEICAALKEVLDRAFQAHPERFSKRRPKPPGPPEPAWINPPKKEIAA